jgi:hypothetical protein
LQVGTGLLGLGGNYTAWRRLPGSGSSKSKTWQDFLLEAEAWRTSAKAKYGYADGMIAMALSRQQILRRLTGLEGAVL